MSQRLHIRALNDQVCSVHTADGAHVGNLNKVGAVWKFKAIGYDTGGAVEPGGGPLTGQHNTVFETPSDEDIDARLSPHL